MEHDSTTTIRARLEREDAPGWRPNPGESVVGTVVEIDEAMSDFGDGSYAVITVEQDDGTEVAVHAFHTVLKSELARRRPQVGDQIGIKYLGIPKGKRYAAYKIATCRRAVDVTRMDVEAPAETHNQPPDQAGVHRPPPGAQPPEEGLR